MGSRAFTRWRRFPAPMTALVLLSGCAEAPLYSMWPELSEDSVAVAVAVECDGHLAVDLRPPDDIASTPLRLEDCETGAVSLLEYEDAPETYGLAFGPLEAEASEECGVLPLPKETRSQITRWSEDSMSGFEPAIEGEPRVGALASFRTRQQCPCRPMALIGTVDIESANSIIVEAVDDDRAFVFTSEGTRLEVYLTDLNTIQRVASTTIALNPTSAPYASVRGLSDAAPGPDGRYYLAADLGEIYSYELDRGLSPFATVPGQREIIKLAASPESEPWALYVLTDDNQILRLSEAGWYTYPVQSPLFEDSSQRPSVIWIDRGNVFVVPHRSDQLLFIDGDLFETQPWTEFGSIHAAARTEKLGIVAATRRSLVFQIDFDQPGEWSELIGPNGLANSPTSAWFAQIRPTESGFIAALEGPDSLISFDEAWGYCPQQVVPIFDVGVTRLARVGTRVLGAGARRDSAPVDGPIGLPIFEPE